MSYIPRGCDQQGRNPQAAEAATEVGAEETEHEVMQTVLLDVLLAAALVGLICVVVLLASGRG